MRRLTIFLLVLIGFLFCVDASSFAQNSATPTASSPDTTTQGNWQSLYGAQGYFIPNSPVSFPAQPPTYYPVLSDGGAATWTWGVNTGTKQAVNTGGKTDIASAWYNDAGLEFDLNLGGGPDQVAMYLLDYDTKGRSESVQVMDGDTNAPINSAIPVSNFTQGTYLIWNITGHVKIQITKLTGPNAVASGLFFGGSANASAVLANAKIVFITAGFYNGNLGGLVGADAICQTEAENAGLSGTYKAWISVAAQPITISPSTDFTHLTNIPYYEPDGKTEIAANWNGLVGGNLLNPIDETPTGAPLTGIDIAVWTGTTPAGINSGPSCNDWTSASSGLQGSVGDPLSTSTTLWSEVTTLSCNFTQTLYCFQQ